MHSRITFYVQKGIRKGIQDQQCRFCITDTSMQKVKFVRTSQSIFADNFCSINRNCFGMHMNERE